MKNIISSLGAKMRQVLAGDNGNSTVEFALVVPLIMTIFIASFESGFVMLRLNLLQHALDTTMRDLRLGHIANPSHDDLKSIICTKMTMITDCQENILVDLEPIQGWTLPDQVAPCVDRTMIVAPVTELNIGQQNQLMLVRVCIVQDMVFGTAGLALAMPEDSNGQFNLVAVSAYVNEPR